MSKESKKVDAIFKFMTPEEIDAHFKTIVEASGIGTKSSHKWSNEDVLIRRQVIIEYLGQGLSRLNIMHQLCDRWGCKKSSAYNYIKDAYEALVEDNEEFIKYNRNKQEERLENIMTLAIQDHMYDTFLKASDQLNKIYGLYTEKKEVDIKGDTIMFKFGE